MASTWNIVDLTTEPKDHLTRLPPELQHHIFDYLFTAHDPHKAFSDQASISPKSNHASQPLDYLAATCKSLRAEIMDWSLHFLTQHRNITKYKPLKSVKLQAQRDFLRGRSGILTWAETNCVFCGKKTTRSAIMVSGLHCCKACDMEQWPNKITKTDARKEYDLKDHHLLPQAHHDGKLLSKFPGGLPRLRYGTYMSSNVPTTMFFRKDVEELARLVHGDLKEHLEKRQADREERSRKAKQAMAKQDEDAATERYVRQLVDEDLIATFGWDLPYDPRGPQPERQYPADLSGIIAEARQAEENMGWEPDDERLQLLVAWKPHSDAIPWR